MAFWKWSRTASSNANADSTVNWAEGMAPSAVNDSARAMMARLAEWRDDVSGTITTGGTATAYTLASNQVFDNFPDMNGAMIAFVPHTTNGATVTLNVDGLGAKPLRYGTEHRAAVGRADPGHALCGELQQFGRGLVSAGRVRQSVRHPDRGSAALHRIERAQLGLRAAVRTGDLAYHLCDAVFAGEHDVRKPATARPPSMCRTCAGGRSLASTTWAALRRAELPSRAAISTVRCWAGRGAARTRR